MLGPIGQEDALQSSDHEITGSIPDTVKYSVILKKGSENYSTQHILHMYATLETLLGNYLESDLDDPIIVLTLSIYNAV